MNEQLTFGSVFSGIGGIDRGLELAGLRCVWQIERNKTARSILQRHWNVPIYEDATKFTTYSLTPVDLICGGDPCPKHSHARSNGASRHPDLSGYFLALVGRLRPRWLVRENVPASTVDHFDAALAVLGYGTSIIRMDAAMVTGQSRQRDIIVGCYQASRQDLRDIFYDCEDGKGTYETDASTAQIVPCLTTSRQRYDSRDCYIYEQDRLRLLDGEERETFAGFPQGWTAGLSENARARLCGNSAVPAWFEYIGKRIVEWDSTRRKF